MRTSEKSGITKLRHLRFGTYRKRLTKKGITYIERKGTLIVAGM